MQYQLVTKNHTRRAQVEQFICERYWLSFKACLSQLPDTLLAVNDHEQLVAACGLQFAEQRTLFSECYLNKPLTSHDIAGLPMPKRDEIAEVGSMAAISATYLPTLFAAIVHALEVHQRSAVVFTATRYLQLKLERSGIALSYLADATQSALPSELQNLWGDYYQHQPRVLAGWTHQGQPEAQAMAC
ncbi:thermostable hemolysin-like protein [Pseudidiomarina gelatinasegens]|uniref:Thermostable hemolysin-like protein n=1 Tax=Pseudidiomarina gelatinasegens TaxID=2487740 RepID=A0A451GEU8_9GAMM|nr:thermostable hemolysin [Pseudidiomarina gelatinasegens]RWU11631.1 thermostable hemolysin-like protein [Pseudidiomarina gelatinasegens]